jgi:hypothetical protein
MVKRQRNIEKILENQRQRQNQDRAAKEKISQAMKPSNSSNQMEHNIKIYNFEKKQ